jgi:REP element-mobilizing transposase RayT
VTLLWRKKVKKILTQKKRKKSKFLNSSFTDHKKKLSFSPLKNIVNKSYFSVFGGIGAIFKNILI